jgi:hypothetical protein
MEEKQAPRDSTNGAGTLTSSNSACAMTFSSGASDTTIGGITARYLALLQ